MNTPSPNELTSDPERQATPPGLRCFWVLVIALVVAVLLRSYGLSKESLWLDEAWSVEFSSGSFARALQPERNNPPLYYVSLYFWMKVFGTSEAGARSLSVIPSVVAIILTYVLGKRLYNEKTGLVAACFMAVSSFHVFYAQEARAFALLLALLLGSMLSMDVALRRKRERRSLWPWVAYVLTTVAALYTHFYAVFFVAAENLFFVLRWRESRRKLLPWIAVQVVVILAFMPWLIIMLQGVSRVSYTMRHLLLKFPQAFFSFFAGYSLVPMDEAAVRDIRRTLLANSHYILVTALGFGLIFVTALAAVKRHARSAWFFAAMGFGPMVMALLVSFKLKIFDERYLIGISPVFYIFMASGVTHAYAVAGRWRKPARIITTGASTLALGIALISLFQYYFHPRFGKEQWREVVQYVEGQAQPGDLVVFDRGYIGQCYDYYATRGDIERLRLNGAAQLEKISKYGRVWLVRSHVLDDEVLHRFQKVFKHRSKEHFPKAKGIDVYQMEQRDD